jgi:hypothetical protein
MFSAWRGLQTVIGLAEAVKIILRELLVVMALQFVNLYGGDADNRYRGRRNYPTVSQYISLPLCAMYSAPNDSTDNEEIRRQSFSIEN